MFVPGMRHRGCSEPGRGCAVCALGVRALPWGGLGHVVCLWDRGERVSCWISIRNVFQSPSADLLFVLQNDPTCVLFLRAIVFVVDSVAFQREVKDVAEFLYQVLVDSTVLKNAPALLIACNKQDVTMAKSAKLIQQQLEKELNTLRVTRSAAPTSLDASATGGPAQLGKKGKDFDFSQLPMKVEFVECSARGSKGEEGDADFEDLEKWLAKIA